MKSFIVDETSQLLKDKDGRAYGAIHVVAPTAREAIGAIAEESKARNRTLPSNVVGALSIRAKKHDSEDVSKCAQLLERDGRIVIEHATEARDDRR